MPDIIVPDGNVRPAYGLTDGREWRIVMLILWIGVPTGIVYVLAMLLPEAPPQVRGAVKFVYVLETLPTLWFFFALALALISVWIFRHRQIHAHLQREFSHKRQDAGNRDLSERDWWVAEGFRKRALDLRLRADLILGGVLVVLFAGVYLVIFVSRLIPELDIDLAKRHQELAFKDRFSEELNAMVAGHYWLGSNSDVDEFETSLRNADETRTRLVRGHEGLVFTTADGGEHWNHQGLEFSHGERVVGWRFSADGQTGWVAGDMGSVFMTTNGGETWSRSELNLEEGERATAVAFSADGRTRLIAIRGGSVFMTMDDGMTRHPLNMGLARGARVAVARLSADGQTGLVADRASMFMTTDGGNTWSSPDLNLADDEWAVAGAFTTDGRTGLIASDEGSVYTTRDGGQTWSQSLGVEE